MITLNGKYNKDCKIFIDEVESSALSTIQDILDNPISENVPVRIMPDTHDGKGIVIGFTMPITDMVNPNYVGVDIGCGMRAFKVKSSVLDSYNLETIEKKIRSIIPMGMNINSKSLLKNENDFVSEIINKVNSFVNYYNINFDTHYTNPYNRNKIISDICKKVGIDAGIFYKSLGSLGSGNHFIEVSKSETDSKYIYFIIHTGSRNFGLKVCNYHANMVKKQQPNKELYNKELDEIKLNTKDKTQIPLLIDQLKKKYKVGIDNTNLMNDYFFYYCCDMVVAQTYAKWNRMIIQDSIVKELKLSVVDEIETIHNYIDFNSPMGMMVRKGAISAKENEYCIIPLNMRDGSLICRGKGNSDWNYSAPHGAGRLYSRSRAKKELSMDEFSKTMEGICTTSVCSSTLDESPMAYKDSSQIESLISPTVDIIDKLRPIINLKSIDS